MKEILDKRIDLNAIITKLAKYWKVFATSILLCLFAAFLYDNSTQPKYTITASVNIDSEDNSLDASSLLFNSPLASGPEEVINQIVIIKSFPLLKRVFQELDFSVNYYIHSFISKVELYNETPFRVVLEKNVTNIPYQNLISIVFTDENTFHLLLDGVDARTKEDLYFEGDFSVGEPIEINGCRFSIQTSKQIPLLVAEKYSFVFNDPEVLLYDYFSQLAINVVQEAGSIISIKIQGSQTEKLIGFVNTLMEVYVKNSLEQKNEAISSSIAFMEGEIEITGDSLTLLSNQLEIFKTNNHINDITLEVDLILNELESLQKDQLRLKQRDNYFDYLINNLDIDQDYSTFKIPSTAGIEDPILTTLISQLINYTIQKNLIVKADKSSSPLLHTIENNIKSLKAKIIENVNSQKNANTIALKLIQSEIELIDNKASKLPEVEKELVSIQRSYQLYENLFLLLQENKTEAEILRSENKADYRIIEPARLESLDPIVPRYIYYVGAIGLGLFLALLFFIIKVIYADKIEDVKELTEFEEIPFLGAVSHVNSWTIDYLKNSPKSKFTESLRILLGNINFILKRVEGRAVKIMLTSLNPEEGKSHVSSNLAILLAQGGKKVLLLDADMRKPSVEKIFNQTDRDGLGQYLNNDYPGEDLVKPSKYKNLSLILSSTSIKPPNPSDLINSSKFTDLLSTLENQYDYIIIDTPPMGLVIDPFLIARRVDATLLVVREEYSRLDTLEGFSKYNSQGRLGNCGIILNDSKSAFNRTYSSNYYIEDSSTRTFISKVKSFFQRVK